MLIDRAATNVRTPLRLIDRVTIRASALDPLSAGHANFFDRKTAADDRQFLTNAFTRIISIDLGLILIC